MNATCDENPISKRMVKELVGALVTPISEIVNLSLQTSTFPSNWKCAVVLLLLKKVGLDPVYKNFRPASNLPFLRKVLEKCVINQVYPHINNQGLLLDKQSSYRPFYSTETALTRVRSDLLMAVDNQISLVVF